MKALTLAEWNGVLGDVSNANMRSVIVSFETTEQITQALAERETLIIAVSDMQSRLLNLIAVSDMQSRLLNLIEAYQQQK